MSGAENIAELFAMTTRRFPDHGNTPRTRHLVLNPIVELDGDTAAARSTFCVVQDTDRCRCSRSSSAATTTASPATTDGWYFTERIVDVEMVGDVSRPSHDRPAARPIPC